MAALTQASVIELSDAAGRALGSVTVDSVEDGWLLGDFTPGPDFPAVEPMFRTLAEMVEQFSLHFTDEAMAAIARLGVTARLDPVLPPVPVSNVQIDSENGFACRLPPAADRNGHA